MEEFEKLGDPQSELFQAPDNQQAQVASDSPVSDSDPAVSEGAIPSDEA
jgi:hypothetical protein